ncbi:hypothetical protein [Desulforegula conservatrix]|uniref:hypothetical protein n=1 Tax=Desulforegula conservatrix TaxID=153026 RepID=UPI0003FA0D2F|nr:hypothetical protein [Desulforegula conservatrix]
MTETNRHTQLEEELLAAQVLKTQREADALNKTTFEKGASIFVEGIKLVGALIIGVGGLLTGFQGLEQAKKAQQDADKAIAAKQAELIGVESKLQNRAAALQVKEEALFSVDSQLKDASKQLLQMKLDIATLPQNQTTKELQTSLDSLDTSIGEAYVSSGSGITAPSNASSAEPLDSLIEGLFAETASKRGEAYRNLMTAYGTDSRMIGSLIEYARANKSNSNGIYNTLVVLSHVNYSKLENINIQEIRDFAEKVRANGEKTSQRVDVLLKRLPK